MDAYVLGLVAVLVLIVFKLGTRNHEYWRRKGVESVGAVPFVGSMWPVVSLREHMADFFHRLAIENKGKKFVGYFQGSTPGLLVLDPELIRSILISDFSHFVDHGFEIDPEADPMQSRNLFNMSGQYWKEMRSMLSPTFSSGKIKALFPLVQECATSFENYMLSNKSQDINIKDLLARFTTNVIGSCAFGITVNSLENPEDKFRQMGRKLFEVDFVQGFKNSCIFFQPQIANIFKFRVFSEELTNFFRNLVHEIMDKRAKSGNTRKDFLQLLIQLKEKGKLGSTDDEPNENNESSIGLSIKLINCIKSRSISDISELTDDDIVAQALVFFIGGFESTSMTLTYTLMELARNPEAQRKARANIKEVLQRHDGILSFQSMQELTYLDKIANETLRMYPPLAVINRICTKQYKIPNTNVTLEKGTAIAISVKGIQNDPQYFEDPETFNPDRFSDENPVKTKCAFMPFGEGPRQCIGMRFAKMPLKLGLFSILRHFEVLQSPNTVYPPEFDPRQFFLASKHDIYVQLRECCDY
ncbi:Hypothetical predicted protein [Cloeon dipterum]|uniref:Cytochrome P450 n=1 Tax=Cloeon dipterum TaxID=197152 RepID=A0A8S1CFC6_9INSE|nr:Hypothetical predicted protein [Cloeon dipterum]